MNITEIKLDSPAEYPTFDLVSDQVWTNFYLEADATVTEYGSRYAYPNSKIGDTVAVQFGYRARRGMTDDGQPGWKRHTGDALAAAQIEDAIRTAKSVGSGPDTKVKHDTIRLIRVDKRTTVQSNTQIIDINDIGDLSIYRSSFNPRFG